MDCCRKFSKGKNVLPKSRGFDTMRPHKHTSLPTYRHTPELY
jgi:hypothetical protein